jgi:hypothetical protein
MEEEKEEEKEEELKIISWIKCTESENENEKKRGHMTGKCVTHEFVVNSCMCTLV